MTTVFSGLHHLRPSSNPCGGNLPIAVRAVMFRRLIRSHISSCLDRSGSTACWTVCRCLSKTTVSATLPSKKSGQPFGGRFSGCNKVPFIGRCPLPVRDCKGYHFKTGSGARGDYLLSILRCTSGSNPGSNFCTGRVVSIAAYINPLTTA